MRITKKLINAKLREASWTPSNKGPMRVIMDVGNIDYYIRRAQECLAIACSAASAEYCAEQLRMASRLIILATINNEES